jgi:DNA-binding CsgD family transcriptional regulator
MGLPEWVFEGNVTLARVLLAGGDRERAAAHGSRADRLFESEIEPRGMAPLVGRALGYREAYRSAALEAPGRHGGLIEPLNERELEVLGRMAAGRSNQEIADELFLSVNTVKWHARNAYGKLGVGRRTQAVERARELGLL